MDWTTDLRNKYHDAVAHCFLLVGNVNDYVDNERRLVPYLEQMFANRDVIIIYDRSRGISFATPGMRQVFLELVGMNEQSETMKALGYLQGGSQDADLPTAPLACFNLIEKALLASKNVAVIIQYAETLFPPADMALMSPEDRTCLITLLRWASESMFVVNGNPIFLIAGDASDVHPMLRAASSKIELIEVPLPNYEERLAFIRSLDCKPGDITDTELAALTAGLMKLHIEDIKLRSESIGAVTRELVRERKEDIIRAEYGEVLEIIEPDGSLDDIGGYRYIKDYVMQAIVEPIRRGNKKVVPMGVLEVGPAGTGKTAFTRKLAGTAGVNFVQLKMSKILGQYVGNSERNLARALACIKSLTPCFVFVDEIEQAFQRQTDSGNPVGGNLFGMLLEFASDTRHRGDIVLFAATNRPDLMDPALKRPGRFDCKIPFLAPEQEDRVEILKVMLARCETAGSFDLEGLARRMEGYTGAEMEQIVVKAQEVAARTDGVIRQETVEYALDVISPSTSDVEFMTNLALMEVNDKELLPPRYRERLNDRKALEERVQEATSLRRTRRIS